MIKKRRINSVYLIIGLLSIAVSLIIANYINTQRIIRTQGQLLNCPIVEINYSGKGGNSGYVVIEKQVLKVSSLASSMEVGDSIWVRYIRGILLLFRKK